MRDGQGTKLSEDEAEKVKATIKPKQDGSLNQVSVDPAETEKPKSSSDDGPEGQSPPSTPTF